MSGFKNILKSDTPTSLGGQGSHFGSQRSDDPPFATRAADTGGIGSTVTGSEPRTAGPADTGAALNTAGPEAGGSSHIGTTSASGSAALSGDRTAAQSSSPPGSTTYNFPKTLRGNETSSSAGAGASTGLGANTGSAAVGQTTTYSSRPLASGDPTGSIVDHQSTDPLTYKLPEAGSHHPTTTGTGNTGITSASPTSPTSSSGVTSSAAATAASAAWAAHNRQDKMPGEFPSDDNPYKATNIDPRVDGGKPRSPTTTTQASSSIPYHTRDSALGTSTSTGAGSLGTSHDNTGPAPSTLTSTADPAARAAQYAASSNTKVPDSTPLETTQSQYSGEQQGMMGRALGAMGLGGAASTAAGYLGYGAKGSDTTEPRDSSAIATQPGVAAQESGPPKHYRRESIPTTAYPSTDAARPIAPPVGGTLDPRRSVDQGFTGSNTDSRISNDRGIGGTPATTQGVAGSGFGLGSATSGVPRQEYSESSRVRDNIGTGGTHDSHLGRDVAAGGAAAAVTGAGIHGLQHHGRDDNLRSSAAEDARRDDTFSGGHSYTIGGHQTHQSAPIHAGSAPVDAISSRDPNYRDPSSQGTGFGSTTSPSAPMSAVAAAPSRYEGQDYRRGDDSHTGRDAALGTSAAAAAIYASSSDRDRHGTIHDAITIGTPTTTTAGGRGSIDSRHYETESTTGQSSYGTSTGYGTTASTAGDRNLRQEGDHTGRNIGLGAAAGTAAAGGAAYAEHDRHHERELEKQREHDAKEAAKREKAQEKELEKERSHAEKEERKREKEAEKEERKHEKEVEKEEKRQQKEMDKEEKERAAVAEKREHARLADAEEDRRRREREAAAGVAAVGTTGAVEHESYEKEKKPSIFKRIFKRRKNKDTGEEEEYSSDDEEDKRRYAAAAGGDGEKRYTAAGVPIHLSGDKNRNVLGHDPRRGSGAGVVTGTSAAGTSSGFGTSDQYRDNTTGVPYDSTRDHTYGTGPSGTNTTGLTSGTTGLTSGTTGLRSGTEDRPHDSITGLPYDPSKDPTAAARLSEHEGSGLTGTGEHGILGSEPLGYVGDTRR